ncbi:alpha/beta-hydrolase [Colletotrichum tofieldiae]|nr:alpha/beta-hydrolase [Colletotrichum tofieldiae]GKT68652.1 alpha/beta-hydrolase [Colletotrichum tofieldiae]
MTAANHLPSDWRPGYINFATDDDFDSGTLPTFDMVEDEKSGDWLLTLPFPSGTFQYSFLVDCAPPVTLCDSIVDSDNPPIQSLPGEQASSIVQVPFSKAHQTDDYSWQLPLEDSEKRGRVEFFNYSSPGSTYPASNVHSVGVYLPNGYSKNRKYPIAYFHHGRDGNHADWFNQGRLHQIADRLIASNIIPPLVIITPSFYNLGFTPEQFATNATDHGCSAYDQRGIYAFDSAVRKNYFSYLMPWVESTLSVSTDPASRSFVGLSMGGGLATEMLYNATKYFDSYGVFSQMPPTPPIPSSLAATFGSKKLLYGAGKYDFALTNTLDAQMIFPQAGVKQILNYVPICGGHSWCVWQELAYVFLKDVLFS